MIWLEYLPNHFSTLFQDYYHEGTHQKAPIRLFVKLIRTEVVYTLIFVEGVLNRKSVIKLLHENVTLI